MIHPDWLSMIALFAVVFYCMAQAVRDVRAKRYGWAAAAALSALFLVTMPISTHAVKVDLPMND